MDSSCHGSRPSRPSSPTVTPLGAQVVIQSVALQAVAALLKGQGSGVRDVLGNMSAPWLIVAFLAGGRSRSLRAGGALGLEATLMALAGFCLAFAFAADLGDHGFAGDVY